MRFDPGLCFRCASTLLIGAAAGLVFQALGTPLPWMIGPLLVTAAARLSGAPLFAPGVLRHAGQWVIGVSLGLYFTPQVVAVVASHWVAIGVGVVWALALGAAFGVFLRWANPADPGALAAGSQRVQQRQRLDWPTAFFSSAIGGASEMAALAQRHGGRMDLVASAHSLRVVMVVLAIPIGLQLAGLHGVDALPAGPRLVRPLGLLVLMGTTLLAGALAMRAKVSNPWVLGPLGVAALLSATGVELSALPKPATLVGQLFIGVSLGTQFTPAFLHRAPRWLASVAVGTVAMMIASAGFAWLVARAGGLHPATVLLATAPGGIAEMCITATVLQLGVPVVTAFHVTRMVAVVLLSGPIYRWGVARDAASE